MSNAVRPDSRPFAPCEMAGGLAQDNAVALSDLAALAIMVAGGTCDLVVASASKRGERWWSAQYFLRAAGLLRRMPAPPGALIS